MIRARRIELGLSQEDLADQLGLVRSRLSAVENGRVGQFRVLIEVCTALGLELIALPREEPTTASLVSRQTRLVEHANRRSTNPQKSARTHTPRADESPAT